MKLVIPGTLPSMNEIVAESKRHWSSYSKMKAHYTDIVAWNAKLQIKPITRKADVVITWYCRNRKKDKDNIMAGQKFIWDGLIAAGCLTNDGWEQIGDITHRFDVDKNKPRVEIEIKELTA